MLRQPTTTPPPPIPHTLVGSMWDCRLCHTRGAAGAPAMPADSDHLLEVEWCPTCHGLLPEPAPATAAAPPIPHDLVGREECLTCHKTGIDYGPRIPDDHDRLPVDVCQACHVPGSGGPSGGPTTLAPQVPHLLEGRTDCRACHATGVGGAPQFPADHADRANAGCQVCHALSPVADTPVAGVVAPQVPHPLESRPDCRACHATGASGATQFPADHADRSNESCQTCHAVSLTAGLAPQVPHLLEGRSDCRLCHETGASGATQFPADHADRSNESCQTCHAVSPTAGFAPQVSHLLEGRSDCRSCHEIGASGATQFPADHAGRANEACSVCHTVSPAAALAPQVPHLLEGRSDCRSCHETGASGATQFPPDHAGRSNESCQVCHSLSPVASGPELPHPVVNHADCTSCHGTGLGGTTRLPADHAGRSNEVCMTCHVVSPSAVSIQTVRKAPLVPHVLSNRADCGQCHGGEDDEGPRMPDDHAGWAATTCLTCHGLSSNLRPIGDDD